jgi:asparagine synthase (glutamine-hydrolysing)
MCGIVGIFSTVDRERLWPETVIAGMLRLVKHRGPDGSGIHTEPGLFLGHARLAVLDTSAGGQQPMFSADGRFVITFNGEIYNFRALKEELEKLGHVFASRCDTEVLLAAWNEWGEGALARLDGIFAFALCDRVARTLYLVRDHIGIKPLFYQLHAGSVFFASELKALFSEINPVPTRNAADLHTYFTFNYLPAPRTGLDGVCQLEAGCLLRLDASGGQIVRYWTPQYRSTATPWGKETVACFREVLYRSVRSQLVADVPLGVFLSGGLDSYAVAQAAVAAGELPAAYTIGFKEQKFDERDDAAEYARYLGIDLNAVQFAWHEDIICRTLDAMNELLADASCFPLYQLAAFARAKATVILAGDGGDELLAGYGTYFAGELTPYIRALPRPVRSFCRSWGRLLPSDNERYGRRMVLERLLDAAAEGEKRDHASFRRIFGSALQQRLYKPEFVSAIAGADPVGEYAGFMAQLPPGRSYLAARQHADLLFHLPGILAKVDRMSMAHGLEVRVPLLSKEMVEFCINLDDRAKRTLFSGKRIMKSALADRIPPAALKRRKVGLLPPVDRWFRGEAMNSIFGDYLLTARSSLSTLDWDEVESFWKEHRQGKVEGGFVLLGILQYINWSMKMAVLK